MEINYLPIPEPVGYVDLADGLQVPERLRAEVRGTGLPAVIEIEMAVRDGAVVCDRIEFRALEDGPSITRDMLRELPLGRLVTVLMESSALISDLSHPAWGDVDLSRTVVAGSASAPEPVRDWVEGQIKPGRRRRITEEFLRQVATTYREHLEEGAPTQAVADNHHVSHSTAARYVALARQRGFLGQTRAGRAGEGEA